MRKLNIGLFAIGLDTYWPQFDGLYERLAGYHREIRDKLQNQDAEVTDAGIIDATDKIYPAIAQFKSSSVDLIFLNISTYGLSQLALPIVRELNVPVVVLNLQPTEAIDYDYINSLGDRGKMTGEWLAYCQACVAPEIGGVFEKSGIPFHLITGHLHEVYVWKEIGEWISAARTKKALSQNKVGLMGHYYNGMLDVYTDTSRFSTQMGSLFQILEFGELKHLIAHVSQAEIDEKIHDFTSEFEVSKNCSQYELERAARTSVGLDKITSAYQLTSLAYYYEGVGDKEYEDIVTSLIPGFTLLTGRNIPVAGEYEVKNVHAMKIMDLLGAGGSFSEFYGLDFNDNIVLLGHDGPAHFAIADGKVGLVPLPVYHGKPGKGLSIQMRVKDGPVTVLSVCETYDGSLKLLCAEGESVSGPTLQIGNTNSRYRFSLDPREFTNRWSKEGPSHHMAIGIGHHASTISKIAELMNLSFVQIC